jgi:hypothetical protein
MVGQAKACNAAFMKQIQLLKIGDLFVEILNNFVRRLELKLFMD